MTIGASRGTSTKWVCMQVVPGLKSSWDEREKKKDVWDGMKERKKTRLRMQDATATARGQDDQA